MNFFKLFIILALISNMVFAQQEQGSTGDLVLYRKENHGGVFVHDKGFGIFYRNGVHKTGKIKRFYEFDFLNMKHPKEYKNTSPYDNKYVFGKINSFLLLRTGIGHHRVLHAKDQRKGIEVRYHYYFGSSMGFLKPVYLDVIKNETSNKLIVSQKPDPLNQVVGEIYGKSRFTKGLNELKIEPGLYGKFGFSFEYSTFDEVVRAIETGIVMDAFSKKVPIMSNTVNNQVFVSFYISLVFGKKEF